MKSTFCAAVTLLVAAVFLAGCGGKFGGTVPTPQPVATSGAIIVFPGTASVPLGGTVNFTASLSAQPTATFTWSIASATGNGSINSSTGVYTAPTATVPSPSTVTVTAKSGSATGSATITITAAQPVTVTPSALYVPAGTSVDFSATASGSPATVSSWRVNGNIGGNNADGHITPSGIYTAPLTPPTGESVTITAVASQGSGTAAATIVFSQNSLDGPYAFSYTGNDKSGFLATVGSFTANGAIGTITNGTEDIVDPKTNVAAVAFGGTFTVAPDGTGTASFTDGAGGVVNSKFQFVLSGNPTVTAGQTSQQAVFVRVDANGAGSGTLEQQNSGVLNTPLSLSAYVFGFSGVDTKGHVLNIAGGFNSNAGFSLSPGVWDVNDPSLATTVAPVIADNTLTGTSTTDLAHPGSGRGTMTLTSTNTTLNVRSFSYVFYVVDQTHVKVIENDAAAYTSGDVFSGPNSFGSFSAASVNNNYAFSITGAGPNGPYALAGVLTANGGGTSPSGTSGTISGGVVDENGGVGTIVLGAKLSSQSYSIDATTGRITFTLSVTNAASIGSPTFAAYATSNNSLVIIETDTGKTNIFGQAFQQSSTATLQGGYASNFTVVQNVNGGGQNVAAQFVAATGAVSYGTLYVDNGTSLTGDTITQAVINAPDVNGRGTATIQTSPATYPIAFYTIDANSALLLETDGQRVLTGTIARQF